MAREQAGSGGGVEREDGMKPVRPSLQDRKHRARVEKGLNNIYIIKIPHTKGPTVLLIQVCLFVFLVFF